MSMLSFPTELFRKVKKCTWILHLSRYVEVHSLTASSTLNRLKLFLKDY